MKNLRGLFFFLLLANVAFFAWTHNSGSADNGHEPQRLEKQIDADKLKIIPPEPEAAPTPESIKAPEPSKSSTPEPSKAPPPAATPPAPSAAAPALKPASVAAGPAAPTLQCSALTGLTLAEAKRLQADIGSRAPDAHTSLQATKETASYWVFIPPLGSKAAGDKKMKELTQLGITDSFLIQDAGPNQFAISLGVFSSEEGAKTRLQDLNKKGVRSARTDQRNKGSDSARLEIHADGETLSKLLQQFGSKTTRADCASI